MKPEDRINTFYELFTRSGRAVKLVNLITIYRIVAAPILLILLFAGYLIIFRWLLLLSFFTDLIDGFLARKYKAISVLGSRLDSIGDDLTILVAVIGVFTLRFDFIKDELFIVGLLLILFLIQLFAAVIRYGKISSFHTYGAKAAAILQGTFLLSLFFFKTPSYPLFYVAAAITTIELIEEIILVFIIPKWTSNVKGLYWVLKKNNHENKSKPNAGL